MGSYLMLIIADILLAGNFALSKLYQEKAGTSAKAGFAFNAMTGLFTALIFLAINGFKLSITSYSLIMAVLKNIFCIAYTIVGFKILKMQGMAIYTIFLMSGGMMLPYIWGLLFLDEQFSALRMIGLLLITGGIIASNFTDEKINPKSLALCAVVFLLNGAVSVVSKLHSIETVNAVSANDFIIIGGFLTFIMSIAGCLADKRTEKMQVGKVGILALMFFAALVSGLSYLIQLMGAKELPATVLYPFITGGSMIFSAVAGRIFFKEKFKRNIVISIALCFIGTLMFL